MSSNYTSSTAQPWRDDEGSVEGSSRLNTSPLASRPRNRRLLSGFGDDDTDTGAQIRGKSPIPKAHPSQPNQRLGVPRQQNGSARANGGRSPSPAGSSNGNASFGKGLWEGGLGFGGGWSAIQGVAQTLLGGENNGSGLDKSAQSTARRRNKNSFVPAPELKEWGPNGVATTTDRKGKGREGETQSERMAKEINMLRTASTLESHDGVNGRLPISNTKSKHKRKSSNDDIGTMAQPDEDGDALVYVHHVQPSDTLAGVILKYNVDPAVFKKANRLWPNDAIQARKVVLIPVEASAVRGKPCEAPRVDSPGVDLLAPTPQDEEPPNLAEDSEWANGILSPSVSNPNHRKETPSQLGDEEQPWVHVRWVLLSSSPNTGPTEIARLPRRSMGYFPPRRRKSQGALSPFATPRPSFDLASPSPVSSPGLSGIRPPGRRLSNLSSSISSASQSYFPPTSHPNSDVITSAPSLARPPSTTRPRANSRAQSRNGPDTWFFGPGGVGTFAPNVRKPGPANDGLNKLVEKHFPKLAVGDKQSMSSVNNGLVDEPSIGWGFKSEMERLKDVALNSVGSGSGSVTPTGNGGGIDVGAAAQAIEGWMRRLGARPSLQNLKGGSSSGRGRDEDRMGDLIELLDGAGSDDGLGFEPTQRSGSAGVRKRGGKTD